MEDTNVLEINCPQAVCRKAHKDGVYTLVNKGWSVGTSLSTFHSVVSVHIRSFLPYWWKRYNVDISEARIIY